MTKRRHGQRCALALALDQVGERWTLLLVRDLLGGAKRYGELLEGLPAMGSNLLAQRLKALEEIGLLERDEKRYSLSARGRELEPAILALARFGAPLLAEAEPEDSWRPDWNVVALKYAFKPERAQNLNGVIEYRVDESCVQARFEAGAVETSGDARWSPDLVIHADSETFLALSSGELDMKGAEDSGALRLEGSRRLFRASLRAYGLA